MQGFVALVTHGEGNGGQVTGAHAVSATLNDGRIIGARGEGDVGRVVGARGMAEYRQIAALMMATRSKGNEGQITALTMAARGEGNNGQIAGAR